MLAKIWKELIWKVVSNNFKFGVFVWQKILGDFIYDYLNPTISDFIFFGHT